MKRALITGDKGFVGRHMTRAVTDLGYHVNGVDIVDGDGLDVRSCLRHDNSDFDLVIHCAAVVGGRALIEGSPLAVAVDLAIDAELFQWAVRTKPGRVVYFSSSAAYPIYLQTREYHAPLREDMIEPGAIAAPDLTYGWSKLTGEMLAGHARAEGVPVTVLRPFSGYGTDQALDYPFPSFIDRARRRADPFAIWGDGTQTRDWVHIDDIVSMTMLCVEEGIDGPLNIGTGRSTSFLDLQRLVCEAAGYSPRVKCITDAPAGVHHRIANTAVMSQVYEPKVTLEEGIDRAMRGTG